MNNATIQEDYTITIPQDIRKELNWKEGDTLVWEIKGKDTIIVRKERSVFDIKQEEIEYYLNQEVYEDWTW